MIYKQNDVIMVSLLKSKRGFISGNSGFKIKNTIKNKTAPYPRPNHIPLNRFKRAEYKNAAQIEIIPSKIMEITVPIHPNFQSPSAHGIRMTLGRISVKFK